MPWIYAGLLIPVKTEGKIAVPFYQVLPEFIVKYPTFVRSILPPCLMFTL